MGQLKAVVTADWHLSNALPHSEPLAEQAGLTDRFRDQINAIVELRKEMVERDVEHLVIVGDLWDKRLLDAVTLRMTIMTLSSFGPDGISIWIVPGNHDASSPSAQNYTVDAFHDMGLHHVHVLGMGARMRFDGWLTMWSAPFMPVEATRKLLDEMVSEPASPDGRDKKGHNRHLLLLHNSIRGASMGGRKCDDGLSVPEVTDGFDYTLAGHFHGRQMLTGHLGEYVGAPWQRSFAHEDEPVGWPVYTFDKASAGMEVGDDLIECAAPRFWTAEWDEKLGPVVPDEATPGDYVRVTVKATASDWERVKAKVKTQAETLTSDGFKPSVVRIPVSHHAARLTESVSEEGAPIDYGEMVAEYVELPTVNTDGLSIKRLKKMGRLALTAVRGK